MRLEKMMKLKIILEPSADGGYSVTIPSFPGCISEGSTKKEALKNIKEAILLYLEPVANDLNYPPNSEIVEISL
jgi:predicted RNase H-like HicB family nuclease